VEIASGDVERRIGPALLEREFSSPQEIIDLLEEAAEARRGMECALSAVDGALFRLLARAEGRPVFEAIREHLYLPPLTGPPRVEPLFTRAARASQALFDGSTLGGEEFDALDGEEAFSSVEQFMHTAGSLLPRLKAVIQPFHQDMPHLASRLRKEMRRQAEHPPLLLARMSGLTMEKVENTVMSGSADGISFAVNRDGGLSMLLRLCQYVKDGARISLLYMPGPSTPIGAGLVREGTMGALEFLTFAPGLDVPEGEGGPGGMDYVERAAPEGTVVFREGEQTVIHSFPFAKQKPDFRHVTRRVHPR
jgi:hypothetical protein